MSVVGETELLYVPALGRRVNAFLRDVGFVVLPCDLCQRKITCGFMVTVPSCRHNFHDDCFKRAFAAQVAEETRLRGRSSSCASSACSTPMSATSTCASLDVGSRDLLGPVCGPEKRGREPSEDDMKDFGSDPKSPKVAGRPPGAFGACLRPSACSATCCPSCSAPMTIV
eukprot:TRINITY_DN67318_c0_g1_i1.p1 TRINITY_DN67318_c0_g1~~TRINITY_DN67318_c0_g1_i1.p1  ORF type:complete len:170 (+),score=20.99 TRINITY_DN67318_c0_g1_i1:102-611(+)